MTESLAVIVLDRRSLELAARVEGEGAVAALRRHHGRGVTVSSRALAEVLSSTEAAALDGGPRLAVARPTRRAWTSTWRTTFHVAAHEHLRAALADGSLDGDAPRRLLGARGWEALRCALERLHGGDPLPDDAAVAVELGATWADLACFGPSDVDTLLGELPSGLVELYEAALDLEALQAATRPAGDVARPVLEVEAGDGPPAVGVRPAGDSLARRAEDSKNRVRAAISWLRAGEVDEARQALGELAVELDRLGPPGHEPWLEVLWPLLRRCTGRRWDPATRLLFDLQKAASDARRVSWRLDPLGWATSLGRRPLRRQVEGDPLVRPLRHLRRARRRVGRLGIDSQDRARLAEALRALLDAAEERVHQHFAPRIRRALEASGLGARDVAEAVALQEVVDRLAGRLVARGATSLSDLRDALAGGELALPDPGWGELVLGDALLRADKALASELGVHRRGDVYLRWLQLAAGVLFGTVLGRWLMRLVAVPFGGAWVLLEGFDHLVAPPVAWLSGVRLVVSTPEALLVTGAVLLALLHLPAARATAGWVAARVGRALAAVLVDAPRRALRVPLRVLRRWRWFRRAEYALERAGAWVWDGLRHQVVARALKWVMDGFAWALDRFERGLYAVDEFLRFDVGQAPVGVAIRVPLAGVWSVVSWVARLYVTVLVEPQVNPIKHFPVVTVSHKIILPLTVPITTTLSAVLVPVLGAVIGSSLAVATVFLLPGFFGFLVWELKEDWRLYRGNRGPERPLAVVGGEGETMDRLLRLRFHSGTVPRRLADVRRGRVGARSKLTTRGAVGLEEVERAARAFVRREVVGLVSGIGGTRPLAVGAVDLAPTRVHVEVEAREGGAPLVLGLELEGDRVGCRVVEPGWFVEDEAPMRLALEGLRVRSGGGDGHTWQAWREAVTELTGAADTAPPSDD